MSRVTSIVMASLWACGAPVEPEVAVDPSVAASEAAAVLRARVAAELDCPDPNAGPLCALAAVGEGSRASWPSGGRAVLPGVAFGVSPSRTLVNGMLRTADLALGIVGDDGVAVLGIAAPSGEEQDALRSIRGRVLATLRPGAAPTPGAEIVPAELLERLDAASVALDPVQPGASGWSTEGGTWFALPEAAAPARWARITPDGEAMRVVVLLDAGGAPAGAEP